MTKFTTFLKHVIGLGENISCLLPQIGNSDQTPFYFDVPTNMTIDGKEYKNVIIRKC